MKRTLFLIIIFLFIGAIVFFLLNSKFRWLSFLTIGKEPKNEIIVEKNKDKRNSAIKPKLDYNVGKYTITFDLKLNSIRTNNNQFQSLLFNGKNEQFDNTTGLPFFTSMSPGFFLLPKSNTLIIYISTEGAGLESFTYTGLNNEGIALNTPTNISISINNYQVTLKINDKIIEEYLLAKLPVISANSTINILTGPNPAEAQIDNVIIYDSVI